MSCMNTYMMHAEVQGSGIRYNRFHVYFGIGNQTDGQSSENDHEKFDGGQY